MMRDVYWCSLFCVPLKRNAMLKFETVGMPSTISAKTAMENVQDSWKDVAQCCCSTFVFVMLFNRQEMKSRHCVASPVVVYEREWLSRSFLFNEKAV